MREFIVKISEYKKNTFTITAYDEDDAEEKAFELYKNQGESYSVNVREKGVNGN